MIFLPDIELSPHSNTSEVMLHLIVGTDFPDESLPRLREVMDVFCVLADRGMIALDFALGADSVAFRLVRQATASAGAAREVWSYQCVDLAVGTYRLLVNALHCQFPSVLSSLGLSLRPAGTSHPLSRVDAAWLSKLPYPRAPANMPFTLEDNLLDPLSRQTMVRVEFEEPLSDEVLNLMADGFCAWEKALQFGAYVEISADSKSQPPAFSAAEWYRLSHHDAEYALYNCSAPLAAIDLIFNLIARVHLRFARVATVEAE